jgi:glycosyltransferase involved in cell wall biosynthesis
MAGMDVFVLGSRWEGLPVALMEALALGLPIVATRVGGVAEVLVSSAASILVPPADPVALAEALQLVLDDPGRRASMGQTAQLESTQFDIGRVAKQLEDIYFLLTSDQRYRGA